MRKSPNPNDKLVLAIKGRKANKKLRQKAIKPHKFKVKYRPFEAWMFDFNYLKKLSIEDHNFLAQYWAQEINGWVPHTVDNILDNNKEHLLETLRKIKSNPEEYAEFEKRKKYFNKKNGTKSNDLKFLKEEITREANAYVHHRREDTYSLRRTNEVTGKPEAAQELLDELALEENIKMYQEQMDDDVSLKEAFEAISNNEFEIFIYDWVLELCDELNLYPHLKEAASQFNTHLGIVYDLYSNVKIDYTGFVLYLYSLLRTLKVLKHPNTFEIGRLMRIYERFLYPKLFDKEGNLKIHKKSKKIKTSLRGLTHKERI